MKNRNEEAVFYNQDTFIDIQGTSGINHFAYYSEIINVELVKGRNRIGQIVSLIILSLKVTDLSGAPGEYQIDHVIEVNHKEDGAFWGFIEALNVSYVPALNRLGELLPEKIYQTWQQYVSSSENGFDYFEDKKLRPLFNQLKKVLLHKQTLINARTVYDSISHQQVFFVEELKFHKWYS
ncbi:hypothetical protein A5881_002295 [Enterococcus termitis]|nr:hypothetical protein A5881_001385 [Enterococcus termitis]